MLKRWLRTRVARLEQRGATTVLIEMDLCGTQKEYEQAFALAWNQVPDGATIFCWLRELSSLEYLAMAEGRQVPPHNVLGIYIKPLRLNAEAAGDDGCQRGRQNQPS